MILMVCLVYLLGLVPPNLNLFKVLKLGLRNGYHLLKEILPLLAQVLMESEPEHKEHTSKDWQHLWAPSPLLAGGSHPYPAAGYAEQEQRGSGIHWSPGPATPNTYTHTAWAPLAHALSHMASAVGAAAGVGRAATQAQGMSRSHPRPQVQTRAGTGDVEPVLTRQVQHRLSSRVGPSTHHGSVQLPGQSIGLQPGCNLDVLGQPYCQQVLTTHHA